MSLYAKFSPFQISVLSTILFISFINPTKAQVLVTTAGSGPTTLTVDGPVNFTITTAAQVAGVVFQNTWNTAPSFGRSPNGSTFNLSLKDNTSSYIATLNQGNYLTGVGIGSISPTDSYLTLNWSLTDLNPSIGDQITLTTGTYTTSAGMFFPSGAYPVFLVDQFGNQMSTDGIATVPEPSTWATLLGGLSGLALFRQFRRKNSVIEF